MRIFKISLVFILLSFSSSVIAQDSAFYKAMKKGLEMMTNNESLEDLQKTANMFDRISEKEKEEWLPLYYSGLNYIYMSFSDSLDLNQRDAYLAKAKERATKADELLENNVEVVILLGYIDMARLSADPASRGPSLSPVVLQSFGKALAMDPKNPRALVMMARMEQGMAQFFGSGYEKPCGLANQSLASYSQQEEGGILPYWGKEMAEQMVKSCEKLISK